MNMKPKLKVLIKSLLPLLLIFLVACSGLFGKSSKDNPVKQRFTGRDGLVMEFIENAPPKEVYEKSIFPLALRLFNRGACDIGEIKDRTDCNSAKVPGYLRISMEKDYLSPSYNSIKTLLEDPKDSKTKFINYDGQQKMLTFSLKSKDIQDVKGGQDMLQIEVEAKPLEKLDPKSSLRETPITVTACYPYKTIASADICIDTDPFNLLTKEKVCEAKDIKLDSQGAPLAVTRIETQMIPKKGNTDMVIPSFIITIENKGKGEVIFPEGNVIEAACSSSAPIDYKKWYRGFIIVSLTDPIKTGITKGELKCDEAVEPSGPKSTFSLKSNIDMIRCFYEPGISKDKGAYTTPLNVELEYGYTESISSKMFIKRISAVSPRLTAPPQPIPDYPIA
ncbi:hypothetical protein HYU13_05430 [Candidatus Woesearchaeota archaeon]|nr:hypothetical protein [Candidatus Woesearchaeota archaeon]